VEDLRRATPADAAELTRLRAFMLQAMGRDTAEPGWEAVCEQAFVRRLGQPEVFAAWLVEQDGRAVSCGVGWLEEHLPSPGPLDARRGHIASMSTDPAHRRRGYGRRVFGALMAWFAELEVPRVGLRATEDGRPLYEAHGFRVLGGATMAWAAYEAVGPGLGFATRP
jgi:GNAT superfamily N-acetyltransferase